MKEAPSMPNCLFRQPAGLVQIIGRPIFPIGANGNDALLAKSAKHCGLSIRAAAVVLLGFFELIAPASVFASCTGPIFNMGMGPELIVNPSPTPGDIDSIDDAEIISNMLGDFSLLLQSQQDTYQLFGTWDANCPTASEAYHFAQQVAHYLTPQQQASLNTLAVAVVASGISNMTTFGFNTTINAAQLNTTMQAVATQNFIDQVATAIYTVRFQRATGQNNTYFFTVKSTPSLAPPFQQYVSAQAYINQLVTEVQTGQPNAYHKAELVTYKLNQLSASAFSAVSTLYSGNNLPVYSGVWSNLVIADQLSNQLLTSQISQVISQTTVDNQSMSTGYGTFLNRQTTTYGAAVQAFVNGPVAEMGLASGTQPSNVTTCSGLGVSGCN